MTRKSTDYRGIIFKISFAVQLQFTEVTVNAKTDTVVSEKVVISVCNGP